MILVIGDAMLDVYEHHEVTGMDPTEPVPKLRHVRTDYAAGGAANVAANVRSLGGEVCLVAAWGGDEKGERLASLMPFEKVRLHGARTTVKRRILAGERLLCRVDWSTELYQPVAEIPQALLADAAVVVVADYDHGVVTDALLDDLKARHPRVIVDPKRVTRAYRGVHLLKPNMREAAALVGRELPPERVATAACELYETTALVTDGAQGAHVAYQNGLLRHFPGHEVPVFDVTGAGDTVIAAVAVALSRGESLDTAIEFAMRAGAAAVRTHGTRAVSLEEAEALSN